MKEAAVISAEIDSIPIQTIIEIEDGMAGYVWELINIYIFTAPSFIVKSGRSCLRPIWSKENGGIIKDSVVKDVIKQITPEADAIVKQMEDNDE